MERKDHQMVDQLNEEITAEEIEAELADSLNSIKESGEQDLIEEPSEKTPDPSDEIESLKVALAEKENAFNGLRRQIVSVREERANMKGQMEQFNQTLSNMQKTKVEEPEPESKYELSINDEGNPELPVDIIQEMVRKETIGLQEELRNQEAEIDRLRGNVTQTNANADLQGRVRQIISSNEKYPEAQRKVEELVENIDVELSNYINNNGMQEPKSIEDAISLYLNSPLANTFSQKNPGIDPVVLMEAKLYGTERHFKNALNMLSTETKVDRIDNSAILNKPSSLASQSGTGSHDDLTVVERFASMDQEDFNKRSDEEIDKLLALSSK